ncbi:lysoplasmalogenase [Colwellia sp. MEBiC06753]
MPTKLTSLLTFSFFASAICYLLLINSTPFLGQFAVKALPIFCLIIIALINLSGVTRLLTVAALVASAIGDIMLALTIEQSFIFGLAAFLVAQLLYAINYFRLRSVKLLAYQKLMTIAICLFAAAMAFVVLPKTADLMISVAIYLAVITLMAIAAWQSRLSKLVGVGALSFLCSDAILALSIFSTPLAYSSHWVMLTYYAAQYLMLTGVRQSEFSRTLPN